MSNVVFPSAELKGLTFSQFKIPTVSRRFQRSVSGRELAVPDYANPIWNFRLPFSFLRDYPVGEIESEMRLLLNFYIAMVLSGDTFLYFDKDDWLVTDGPLGTGDGSETAFQLIRYFIEGGFAEHITAPQNIEEVKLDDEPTTAYSIDTNTGIITFDEPPGPGVAATATFSYYFRCRFSEDTMELEKLAHQLWTQKELRFRSVVL